MSSSNDHPPPEPLAAEVHAEPRYLPALRDHLTRWLEDADAPDELIGRVVLAMSEAATNSMAHAYMGIPLGNVRVKAEMRSDGTLCIGVEDDGHWRPARPTSSIGGRGVLLMQESVDQVFIDRAPNGTTITLLIRFRDIPVELEPAPPPVGGPRHKVKVRMVGETTVAMLSGEIRQHAAEQLRKQLLTATCGGVVPLIVDLAELDHVNEALLGALSHVARAAAGAGERVLVVPSPRSTAAQRNALADLGYAVQVLDSGPALP